MPFDVISYTEAKKTRRQVEELSEKLREAELKRKEAEFQVKELSERLQEAESKLKEAELRIKKTERNGIILSIVTFIIGQVIGILVTLSLT